MKQHFRLDTHPIADPANVVRGDHYRITVLDAGLVRLEYDESGDLRGPGVADGGEPGVRAERLHGDRDRRPAGDPHRPAAPDLRQGPVHHARPVGAGQGRLPLQRLGVALRQNTPNLGGTARTLDDVDGAIPLEDGVLAFNGVAAGRRLRDRAARRRRLDRAAPPRHPRPLRLRLRPRLQARPSRRSTQLTGPTPLLPRYALGNWWSRYHPYTADEYVALMDRFRGRGRAAVRRGHRHGLAPGRHRPEVRQRLDRLHLEHRPVPRPGRRSSPTCTSAAWPPRSTCTRPRACTRTRRRTPRSRSGWASTRPPRCRSTSTRPTPTSSRPTSRSCTTRSRRRASTSGGSTGSRAASPRSPGSTRCGCSTTCTSWTPGATGSGR